jgi:hypothetical protein
MNKIVPEPGATFKVLRSVDEFEKLSAVLGASRTS